jgi:hypothetical protein
MPSAKGDASQDSPSRDGAIDRALEYLFASSSASIESFHLSRLNAIANLRKEIHEIFEEWVEAEVQARLAQGLLARKNAENLAAAGSITINSGEKRAAQIAATRSTIRLPTRLPTRTATRRTAAADSAARSCVARLGSNDPDNSKHASINSSIRGRSARAKNRAARAVTAKLPSRPLITLSATVSRTPRFPLFARPAAAPISANISKSSKATPILLSFRRPNRNCIAVCPPTLPRRRNANTPMSTPIAPHQPQITQSPKPAQSTQRPRT